MKKLATILSTGVVALMFSGSTWAANESPVTAARITAATTSADHEAIAAAYERESAELERKAKAHDSMGRAYKAFGAQKGMSGAAMSAHCERLVKSYKEAAEANRQLAAEHRAMAAAAAK